MIPSILAKHVEQGIKDFLYTTFPITTPFFSNIIKNFLTEPGNVFKGPFLDIQLPFHKGKSKTGYFPDIPMQFPAYVHQENAFDRLSGPNPQSTIIATGTGSGKTECFTYPILDYCFQHRNKPGIKAIIIYPMNALAADQASRLAKLIHNSRLKDHVTAGIYVGQSEKTPSSLITSEKLISDKETLRNFPPDILLTNYKMLDYLLIRPDDRPLWANNSHDTLKFIAVDELHTFDGAQGTDLACLIRRLKARLQSEPGSMCCIGTSATLGTAGEQEELLEYASAVFGETFTPDAVISESRLSAGEFLGYNEAEFQNIVALEKAEELEPGNYNNYQEYIKAQHKLWFDMEIKGDFHGPGWKIKLGQKLKKHRFFKTLILSLKGEIVSFDDIFLQLEKITPGLKTHNLQYKINILNSLLALVSEAETSEIIKEFNTGEKTINRPFLNVRIQLWMRELRRMVASVSKNPCLRFAADLHKEQFKTHLPLVHCRECGSMGWSGLKRKTGSKIMGELRDFYQAFFSSDSKVVFLFPEKKDPEKKDQGKQRPDENKKMAYFCSHCLEINNKKTEQCPACGYEDLILVHIPDTKRKTGNVQISENNCPYCKSHNSLTLVGSRAASLTSVMIVQLYSSTFNDDKKLLTFSDSVQDAAHRAGFFNARTFRFNFRTALQKVVLNSGDKSSLDKLPEIFIDFWTKKIDKNRYISTFLGPNMEWLNDYDFLKAHGILPKESTLVQDINRRISWEIISEYGFQSRIGRTLEKTGSSIAYLDPEKLHQAADRILPIIQNEIGTLKDLDSARLTTFILGLIVRLKNQGALYIPVLDTFIQNFGNSFVINRMAWMPNFGSNSRTPSFLCNKKGSRFDRLFSSASKRLTWYESWADKCLYRIHPLILSITKELYDIVLRELTALGIMEMKTVKTHSVWGILPQSLKISSKVKQLRCLTCGHNISIAEQESGYFKDLPCQRFDCQGNYKSYEPGEDYYGKLYAAGDVERIFAREHTGLLKRDEREQLENDFKADNEMRKPWHPNLLSCTPTLEMGIDIGSLSSLILCSVPPAQANYLQRIGRAGRKDGNALNLTVANARPHDLFFFAEPEQMLAGHVDSPGIFLDASAVLERQFTAFCFDRWIAKDLNADIPKNLGQVLNSLKSVNRKKFPHNLIYFIETNQVDLLEKFVNLFKNDNPELNPELKSGLSADSQDHLMIFVRGNTRTNKEEKASLKWNIMNGLHSRQRERESFKKKIQILRSKIKNKETGPKDKNHNEELREMNIEKSALQTLVRNINDHNTFNFFTDQGLIPNYAFPEAGVILKSLIYRKKKEVHQGQGAYESWSYDYERSASSALAELAPANTFYAEGRKVKIDQVDMSLSEIETWRFCNNCSHKEMLAGTQEKKVCPNCGSPMWADAGQKRQMLKMRQVFASTSDRYSRISDDSDDRKPVFYNKQMFVEFDDDYILDAYKVDADFPFGFDFLSNVDFCEINFGEKSEIGDKVSIAGIEMPRKGFAVCRICGKVQENNKANHALTCTAQKQETAKQETGKNMVDCIYLYRRFKSEAIRILLPVNIISESEKKLQSFIAAIQLGLKKKFKGKIDHLQTTIHEEPLPDSSLKRKYLVLYDTVPGGTGYLKQLMRTENQLMDVLDLSFETMKSCACNQNSDKDGCYRCLFAYRSSYTMPETSRDTAIDLLADILSYKKMLVKTENTRNISFNTFIESELEQRFLGAVKLFHCENMPLKLQKDIINGKPGYFLKIGNRAYNIEPQVQLGSLNGISIESRADFLISPSRSNDKTRPVALFLDGFTWHKNRTGKDVAQRMAIVQSNKYHIWSLSWNDVENRFKSKNNYFTDYMELSELPSGGNYNTFLEGYGLSGFNKIHELNSFDLLIRFLENPDEKNWQKFMFIMSLLFISPESLTNNNGFEELFNEIEPLFPGEMTDKIKQEMNKPFLYGSLKKTSHKGDKSLDQYVIIEQNAMEAPGNPLGLITGCCFYDNDELKNSPDFQLNWNGFLRLYNYYQFLPYSYFVTSQGIKTKAYDKIKHTDISNKTPENSAWDEIKELTDEKYHEFLDLLQNNKWPEPEPGFELEGKHGEILASAELGWDQLKTAFLTQEEMEHKDKFTDLGWKIISLEEIINNPEKLSSI
ncbi:DEAD/DEAH box helicase [Desulfobacterales bacterium HSG17]|nr:DEAD/DEAH box helicase [Desulfobacterales bacterium HSG17]